MPLLFRCGSDVLRSVVVDWLPLIAARALYETGLSTNKFLIHDIGTLHFVWKAQLRLLWPFYHCRPAWHVYGGKLVRKPKRVELHEMMVHAAFSNDTDMLKALIGHCPTDWLSDTFLGVTALHVVRGRQAAWLLCTAGARADACDRHGRTPIEFIESGVAPCPRRVLVDFLAAYL